MTSNMAVCYPPSVLAALAVHISDPEKYSICTNTDWIKNCDPAINSQMLGVLNDQYAVGFKQWEINHKFLSFPAKKEKQEVAVKYKRKKRQNLKSSKKNAEN